MSELLVMPAHRSDCVFGPGFYRVELRDGGTRYCETEQEVEQAHALLAGGQIVRVERDGYCLDGDRQGDANTPDVIDAELWLGMPQDQAMREVGLTNEADYARVYKQLEAAVGRRNDRESQGGVHASIVLKRAGAFVRDM